LAIGRDEVADVARLHDGRRAARELRHQLAFLNEAVEELLALIFGRVCEDLEELDGDGLLPNRVLGLIDDPEHALADGRADTVLLREDRPRDTERVAT